MNIILMSGCGSRLKISFNFFQVLGTELKYSLNFSEMSFGLKMVLTFSESHGFSTRVQTCFDSLKNVQKIF